ncbi:uroporphyrinogen-III C-methyltransferase [Pseudoalteromonas sp. G4]|uniref:uroporphyrinogen-III C-methyltransferase n=1 Tax=Pseudoalteromonas sp. G4 TaxID=2992761 RepID=UPI00237E4EFC|nr:uroporphyrinogen-III C-methyltransferase [Pseudoalteromonas sp. G4]MDE3273592.1 uroporphyrinogen-III synthase [Pseudoalteromonas sp. G4]
MTHILLTRPEEKSQQLAEHLAEKSIKSIIQPLLALEAITVSEQQLGMLDDADIVLFVSQDAARFLHALKPELAKNSVCLAVGKSTAEVVTELFEKPCASPIVETSEGLLAMPELNNVASKRIVLVKGKGGRNKLAKELKEREAIFQPLAVYQRLTNPELTIELAQTWQQRGVDSVVLTSNASIDSFLAVATNKSWLETLTVFLVSERCVDYFNEKAQAKQIINCQGADNESILNAILEQHKPQQSHAMEQEKDITAKSTISDKPANKPKPATGAVKAPTEKQSGTGKAIAVVALLVSLTAVGGLGYGYTLFQQQKNFLVQLNNEKNSLSEQIAAANAQAISLQGQNQQLQNALSAQLVQAESALTQKIEQQLQVANQQEPELNREEVKSLYRMAEFKALVQADYLGAAAMLARLDVLLESFPGTQPAREALHQDIQALNAVQTVDVESIYLRLSGLIANLDKLPLNMVVLPEEADKVKQQALSDNVDDWQANLKRSWDLLVDDFIKVRKRTAPIEPLLSQEEQALIRHQLRFYMVQAQTALVKQQAVMFTAALQQAAEVLNNYYDVQASEVVYLNSQLSALQSQPLAFNPEFTFSSEAAIKELL